MRNAYLSFAVLLLVTLSACPGAGQLETGLWVLFRNGNGTATGLRLLPDGQAEALDPMNLPAGVDSAFTNPKSWSVSGGMVTIVTSNPMETTTVTHTGSIFEGVAASGTFEQVGSVPGSGTWIGHRIGN